MKKRQHLPAKYIENLNQKQCRDKPCRELIQKLMPAHERLYKEIPQRQFSSNGKACAVQKHCQNSIDQIPDEIRKQQRFALFTNIAQEMLLRFLPVKITGNKQKNKYME